jgi:hypothetical protein
MFDIDQIKKLRDFCYTKACRVAFDYDPDTAKMKIGIARGAGSKLKVAEAVLPLYDFDGKSDIEINAIIWREISTALKRL